MAKPPKAAKPIAFFGQDFSGEEKNGTMNEERTATTNTIVTMNEKSVLGNRKPVLENEC